MLLPGAERKTYQKQQADWDAKTKDIRDEMHAMVAPMAKARSRSSTSTAFRTARRRH